jgi:hypothetical protein
MQRSYDYLVRLLLIAGCGWAEADRVARELSA